uniref:Reverse transcriptase/retrotransposon-derived protein RNase H-like domain-containing protein n=1 Tax=Monopterus albus TaxID=43700 RepID=A0A3Q3ILB5_MONAL
MSLLFRRRLLPTFSKTHRCQSEVVFLGHIISASGIRPDSRKTEAIRDIKEPSNVSELRSFLGMVNQLGNWLKKTSHFVISFQRKTWVWDVDQARAFKTLKDALSSPPVLAMYHLNKEPKVSVDALSYGLGAVLLQEWGDKWKPVAYASRSHARSPQLNNAMRRWKRKACLFGDQALDLLPLRIQWFRMRLMQYLYFIVHVPRK